jgi:hypothetical protein
MMTISSRDSHQWAAPPDLGAAADYYAALGWPVFPARPHGKEPLAELAPHGLHSATTDTDRVRDWWRREPEANVAIVTGAASGVWVLDVDPRHGGDRMLEAAELRDGALPHTATATTGGGGIHKFFTHPGGTLKSRANAFGRGLDAKADGGYVIAAPSVHPSGELYWWQADATPDHGIVAAPAEWVDQLLEQPVGNTSTSSTTPVVAAIPSGERNTALASIAGKLRHVGLAPDELAATLVAVNTTRCRPPLPEQEVRRIAASVGSYATDAGEPFVLTTLSAREVVALPDPPASDELLGPLVVRGQRIVLGGHTGEGKTTAALAIVRNVVLGGQFLEWTAGGGCRALVIDAEQGLKTVKRRLREAGLGESDAVDYVRVPDGLSLDANAEHIAAVSELLAEGGYAVVCADPLYKLSGSNSNDEREATDLMRRFDAWRSEHGFALLLPVHCRKPVPGTRFSIHDLFGSSAYVRGAEVVLGLQRLRDGYSRLHFLKDRDGDLPIGTAWGLLFDRESGYQRDPHDGEKKPTAAETIRELLEAQPAALSIDALVEATGYAERTVRDALTALGATGKRDRATDPKLWELADE